MTAHHQLPPDDPAFRYDEFGMFHENCAEFSITPPDPIQVERVQGATSAGSLSALRWGSGPIRLVLVHGGAQNAHTWDTVVLALGDVSALAVDLPGHGHSDHRPDGKYTPQDNAAAVVELLDEHCADPVVLVGMSLGGLTASVIASWRPDLVRRLVLVDITPGVNEDKAQAIIDFVSGPQTFATFDELLERTVEYNPTRSVSSLRRGILHNAHRLPDGSWSWNYDRAETRPKNLEGLTEIDLWQVVSDLAVPVHLLRGAWSPVVDDADVAELIRRQPTARVTVVADAGHSIQGDQPLVLAEVLAEELQA